MFYSTNCIKNSLVITEECAKDLFVQYYERYFELFDVNEYVKHLSNRQDCLEYQDFIMAIRDNNEEVLSILNNHKINGKVCFVVFNGFSDATFFGYSFINGCPIKIQLLQTWLDKENCIR